MGLITRSMFDSDEKVAGDDDQDALNNLYGKVSVLKDMAEARLAAARDAGSVNSSAETAANDSIVDDDSNGNPVMGAEPIAPSGLIDRAMVDRPGDATNGASSHASIPEAAGQAGGQSAGSSHTIPPAQTVIAPLYTLNNQSLPSADKVSQAPGDFNGRDISKPGDTLSSLFKKNYGYLPNPSELIQYANYNHLSSPHDLSVHREIISPDLDQLRQLGVGRDQLTDYLARNQKIQDLRKAQAIEDDINFRNGIAFPSPNGNSIYQAGLNAKLQPHFGYPEQSLSADTEEKSPFVDALKSKENIIGDGITAAGNLAKRNLIRSGKVLATTSNPFFGGAYTVAVNTANGDYLNRSPLERKVAMSLDGIAGTGISLASDAGGAVAGTAAVAALPWITPIGGAVAGTAVATALNDRGSSAWSAYREPVIQGVTHAIELIPQNDAKMQSNLVSMSRKLR